MRFVSRGECSALCRALSHRASERESSARSVISVRTVHLQRDRTAEPFRYVVRNTTRGGCPLLCPALVEQSGRAAEHTCSPRCLSLSSRAIERSDRMSVLSPLLCSAKAISCEITWRNSFRYDQTE